MSKIVHSLIGALVALSAASAGAQTYQRQPVDGAVLEQLQNVPHAAIIIPTTPATPAAARYLVRATTLYANAETNDWSPSDEIYAVFTLRPPDEVADAPDLTKRTSTFGDFDTGETKDFSPTQNCLTSVQSTHEGWECNARGDIGPLQFSVRLYEEDTWSDDFIGERTVQWSREDLASAGLEVGGTSEESIRIGGYTLTWRVERVS